MKVGVMSLHAFFSLEIPAALITTISACGLIPAWFPRLPHPNVDPIHFAGSVFLLIIRDKSAMLIALSNVCFFHLKYENGISDSQYRLKILFACRRLILTSKYIF
jgi:hypothetical protein